MIGIPLTATGTGIDSFGNPSEINALYPFQGFEGIFFVVCVLWWIGWHVRQIQAENAEYAELLERYEHQGMERTMQSARSAQRAAVEEDDKVTHDLPTAPGLKSAAPDRNRE